MKVIFSTPLKDARWPWPKMNVNEVAERALGNEIFMPNIGYVDIVDINDWQAELGDAANSKKLWINSLVTPHACLAESKDDASHKYFKKSVDLIKAYLRQYDVGQGLFDIAWKDEHAVSNRLFVLCAFIHHLVDVEDASLSQLELLYHAEKHAQWLSQDEHYVKNNHGVMMDLSLAQYSVMIRDINPKQADAYLEIALRRLDIMLDDTFDSQGCCTENSPTYHFVNYSLFLSIFSFLEEYAKGFDLSGWEETLEKAKAVGALLLRPDGTVPLIGDSESKPGTFFPNVEPELSKGVGYYPEAGLLVLSDGDLHFTFRAGGRKYSHRHIDDLSITLWAHGKDFIVDSGLYNYDIGDKLRRRFISAVSHSGFYLKSQGHVLFKNFETPEDMSKFTAFEMFDDQRFKVSAVQRLSIDSEVLREVSYQKGEITVIDSFDAATDQEWRYHLVLHPEVNVIYGKTKGEVVLFREGDEVKFSYASCDCDDIHVSQESGYYSERFMVYEETKVLVIKGVSRGVKLKTSFVV